MDIIKILWNKLKTIFYIGFLFVWLKLKDKGYNFKLKVMLHLWEKAFILIYNYNIKLIIQNQLNLLLYIFLYYSYNKSYNYSYITFSKYYSFLSQICFQLDVCECYLSIKCMYQSNSNIYLIVVIGKIKVESFWRLYLSEYCLLQIIFFNQSIVV